MVVSDCEDSLTQLNTELNRSMVLMDTHNAMEKSPKTKSRKSITINTSLKIVSSTPAKKSETRKSILKKRKKKNDEEESPEENEEGEEEEGGEDSPATAAAENEQQQKSPENNQVHPTTFHKPKFLDRRPVTLDEYIENDSLIVDPTAASFTIDQIDEDDELWLFDIPKTLNPREFKDQTFYFGDKTKLKIGNERYLAVSNTDNANCFTCVMGTGRANKRFKTVNIQPSGTIVVRKKLSNVGSFCSINSDDEELNSTVPFPENLKIRHPLMGVGKSGKRMKKFSPMRSRIKRRKSESSD